MKVLRARLYDLKLKEQQAKLDQIGGAKKDIAFGSQIRSYVLQPYQMIKDHRTKMEVGDVHRVLDGDLDGFIKTYLMRKAAGTLGPGGGRRRRLGATSDYGCTRSASLGDRRRLGAGDERFGDGGRSRRRRPAGRWRGRPARTRCCRAASKVGGVARSRPSR